MRTGLYPGTFDPITLGHVDIIKRACRLVDRLVIGVAINRDKGPLFTLEERVAMVEAECAKLSAATGTEIVAHPFENLLIDCARDVGAGIIIRGLRAVADFEYEFQMVGMNRKLDSRDRHRLPHGRGRPAGHRLETRQGDRAPGRRYLPFRARRRGRGRDREICALSRRPYLHIDTTEPTNHRELDMADIKDPENTILIELKDGTVTIELLPDVAPEHSARMKELAREGAYDGVVFHRVIDGFMAQTGDVQHGKDGGNLRMAGTGGSSKPDLPAEFSKLPHDRGTLGAARSQNPNSANSQFFINFTDNHFLNGQYTVYGRVISGMEHVDKITRGEPPATPTR
jgi:peptidylprolyl isomerase